jgi:hypothetical protein
MMMLTWRAIAATAAAAAMLLAGEPTGDSEREAPPEHAPEQKHDVSDKGNSAQPRVQHADPAVDALLDAIESADRGIHALEGELSYDVYDVALDDRQMRWGELRFVVADGGDEFQEDDGAARGRASRPRRVFRIDFVGFWDGFRREEQRQQWGFDGRWLVQRDEERRLFEAREMAPPGASIDPLRLGEGPLPIPIGQRKADILARYVVERRPVLESLEAPEPGALLPDLAAGYRPNVTGEVDATQLKLTPIERDPDGFDEIRLWYAAGEGGRMLPRLARAVRRTAGGEPTKVVFVQLVGVEVNPKGLDEGGVVVEQPTGSAAQEWSIKIEPWRERE